ncbi:hypothetical protein Hanom_Chr06g00505221 [Helianthus anomalus]
MSPFESQIGFGATAPDMSESESLEDDVVVPLGRPKIATEFKVQKQKGLRI